jgi:hypothetical protein
VWKVVFFSIGIVLARQVWAFSERQKKAGVKEFSKKARYAMFLGLLALFGLSILGLALLRR